MSTELKTKIVDRDDLMDFAMNVTKNLKESADENGVDSFNGITDNAMAAVICAAIHKMFEYDSFGLGKVIVRSDRYEK